MNHADIPFKALESEILDLLTFTQILLIRLIHSEEHAHEDGFRTVFSQQCKISPS